jgi:predicted secreted hydrolase
LVAASLLVLAAGLTTVLLIFRRPTPARFEEAAPTKPPSFPRDEAAHFNMESEWWYYTGFLTSEDLQRYGFELVFFKTYVPPAVRIANVLPLNWISNPLYFAHFAISNEAAQKHVFVEQVAFPKFWDASAKADRYRVTNGSWQAWGSLGQHHLRASTETYRLSLDLASSQPPVLHGAGDAGVVDMGQAGTSCYYSEPDLQGSGLFTLNGVRQEVTATVWMDHQWGSWDMVGGIKGWDWFSLRLDDGNRIMLFEFRNADGSIQAESSGTWIDSDGTTEHMSSQDYAVEVLDRWTSPTTGAVYPVRWHVTVPGHGLDVTVAATFSEQEMDINLGPIYWEGTVGVDGTATGVGYVEMTGYAGVRQ